MKTGVVELPKDAFDPTKATIQVRLDKWDAMNSAIKILKEACVFYIELFDGSEEEGNKAKEALEKVEEILK